MGMSCFKAYGIRGKLVDEHGDYIKPRRDVRLTSESLKQARSEGVMAAGVDMLELKGEI